MNRYGRTATISEAVALHPSSLARRPAPSRFPSSLFSGPRFSSAPSRSIGWCGLQGSVRSSLPERLQNERYRAASRAPARGVMRGTRRSRWIIVMCRAACVLLASLASACSPSDEASPRPTPTSPTLPTPPTPPASGGRLQMSGRVLDQNGTPVPGALVEVDYAPAGGVSNPPSHCPVVRVSAGLRRERTTWASIQSSSNHDPGRDAYAAQHRVILRIGLRLLLSRRLRSRRPVGADRLLPRGSGPAAPSHAQHSCWRVDRRLRRRHELAVHRPRGSVAHGQADARLSSSSRGRAC